MSSTPLTIAIIGAGPIGLEAALYAALAGFRVDVYEQGPVAANVRDWGHVRLFSPFGMNSSTWGRRALHEQSDVPLPGEDDLLTGREYVERYLVPISRLPQLRDCIHTGVKVEAIGRSRILKGDLIGRPERGQDRFQLLLQTSAGQRTAQADSVLDCSGVYRQHNWIGAGGIPAVGEIAVLADRHYRLPDLLGSDADEFAGKRTLIVGSGYSAATAVVALAELAETHSETRIVWLTRSERRPPIRSIDNDPLVERDRLTQAANRLAQSDGGPVEFLPGRLIEGIERDTTEDRFKVAVRKFAESNGGASCVECITVDRVIANVGYRPDRRLYEELQVHECYATGGPMKLAAALLGETSVDCLAQTSPGPDALKNPELGFFILGAKSYGRNSQFLIRTGLEQIADVFTLIAAGIDHSD